MTAAGNTGGLPLELIETHPVPCLHVREPGRLREFTVVSGGRVWQLCGECKARLELEWRAAADDQHRQRMAMQSLMGRV